MLINFKTSWCCRILLDEDPYAEIAEPSSFAISPFFQLK